MYGAVPDSMPSVPDSENKASANRDPLRNPSSSPSTVAASSFTVVPEGLTRLISKSSMEPAPVDSKAKRTTTPSRYTSSGTATVYEVMPEP